MHRLLPDDGEVAGLLALMLLTDARRPARTGPDGELIPMAEQDRAAWNADYDRRGRRAARRRAAAAARPGRTSCRRRSRRVHDEAPSADETDWPQIVALYELLLRLSDNPMVALNHAVAVAMVHGPRPGWRCSTSSADDRIADDHRLHAVRAHLLETGRRPAGARDVLSRRPRTRDQPAAAALPPRPRRPPALDPERDGTWSRVR